MINNILTRRKESDTYLVTVSTQALKSVDNDENRLNLVAFSQHCGLHQLKKPQCWLKAFYLFSSSSVNYSDVY